MRSPAISFYFNDHYIANFERIKRAMRRIAEAGYRTVITFPGHTVFSLEDARFIQAVRTACEEGSKVGLQVLLPIGPTFVHQIVNREHPAEAAHLQLMRGTGLIRNGKYSIRLPQPMAIFGYWPTFIGVQVAFLRDKTGIHRLDKLDNTTADFISDMYGDQNQAEVEYFPYRSSRTRIFWQLEGELDREGELIVYAGFRILNLADAASECYDQELDRLLNLYKDMPAGGSAWDEPFGQSGEWIPGSYKTGTGFVKLFKKLNGYDLLDEIYLLDEEHDPKRTTQVRHDYYVTMTEALRGLQSRYNAKIKAYFGEDVGLGSHHTWTGEGNAWDLRAGCYDYFKLTQHMSAGYVDTFWWDPRMESYTYSLATSLGKAYHGGKAVTNTYNWGITTRREQAFHTRLMSMYRMGWFSMHYGDECGMPNVFPLGKNWQGQVDALARLKQVDDLLEGAQNQPDVAIWHGWEGVARINDGGLALYWKACLENTAWSFQERNLPFDFVSSELLIEGSLAAGQWRTRMGQYSTVVFPFGTMMPEDLWRKIIEFSRSGGTVIFNGPPVFFTTNGDDISNEFFEICGIEPFALSDYLTLARERLTSFVTEGAIMDLIVYQRPTRVDYNYPVVLKSADGLIDTEGDMYGVKVKDKPVYYITGFDPQEKLAALVKACQKAPPSVLGEPIQVNVVDAYWRTYEGNAVGRPSDVYLLIMAQSRMVMHGNILVGKDYYEICGTGMLVLKYTSGKLTAALGEDLESVTLNGNPLAYKNLQSGPKVEQKRWFLAEEACGTTLIDD
jgi:hypothetical protein